MQDLAKITGDTLSASEWSQVNSELINTIQSRGITLSGGILNQLSKAIANAALADSFFAESGAADAYVLSPVAAQPGPTVYSRGQLVRFVASNANTGPSTVNLNGLGVRVITDEAGAALSAGAIPAGLQSTMWYDTGAGEFKLLPSSGGGGSGNDSRYTYSTVAGTTDSLSSTNHLNYREYTSATDVTITMVAPSAPFGDSIVVEKGAAGDLILTPDGGVTIETISGGSLTIDTDGQVGSLISKNATTWRLIV